MSLGRQCGFIDEEGQAVGIEKAFLADAVGGVVGAVVCTSTVLRTLSSLLVSLFFFLFLKSVVVVFFYLVKIIFAFVGDAVKSVSLVFLVKTFHQLRFF